MMALSMRVRPFAAPCKLPCPARPRCVVVVSAKPTRASDFQGLNDEELQTKVVELKRQLFDMRIRRGSVTDDVKAAKPDEFKHVKRQVAQCLTLMRTRQIEQGVGRREAVRLEKKAKTEAGFGRM